MSIHQQSISQNKSNDLNKPVNGEATNPEINEYIEIQME